MLKVVAKYDMALSTGHSSPQESLMIIKAAKAAGVNRVFVQHPIMPRVGMSIEMQKEAAKMGALLEYVLGEAMACGTPCVATDVGDARLLIDDTGLVVPKADPAALAQAIATLAGTDAAQRAQLGARARERIVEHFSLPGIVRRYEQAYQDVAAG